MDAWPVWKRLLWKEFRESGIVLAVGVLLALLLIPYRRYDWVPPVGTLLIGLIFILWATYRAQEDQARYRTLLPQAPLTRWVALLVLPLPVLLIFGLCMGVMITPYDPGYNRLGVILTDMMWLMLALFFLTTALTVIFTAIPAILTVVLSPVFISFHTVSTPAMVLYQRVILVMVGALLLWAAFRWRRWQLAGRVVIGLALAVMACWPALRDIAAFRTARIEADAERDEVAFHISGYESNTQLEWYTDTDPRPGFTRFGFAVYTHDMREPIPYIGADLSLPLDLFPDEQILVGQQDNGKAELRLLRWNPASEPPPGRELCRVPFPRKGLYRVTRAFVRPDARYAVLLAKSRLGPGSDLWVIDLARGRAQIAMANTHATRERGNDYENYWRIGWTADDGAVLSFLGELCEVNLATMHGHMRRVGEVAR